MAPASTQLGSCEYARSTESPSGSNRSSTALVTPSTPQHPRDFAYDPGEELLRARALGDERRHAPEGRLLVRQSGHLLTRLRVRDRSRDQLGEAAESELGAGGELLISVGCRDQRAPQLTVDHDRSPERGVDPAVADEPRPPTRRALPAVNAPPPP